jgi:hypothetical protein
MGKTRREFLQSGAALAMGVMSGAVLVGEGAAAQSAEGSTATVQVPKMKFGNAEIGRLVLGCKDSGGGTDCGWRCGAGVSCGVREHQAD